MTFRNYTIPETVNVFDASDRSTTQRNVVSATARYIKVDYRGRIVTFDRVTKFSTNHGNADPYQRLTLDD